MSVTSVGKNSTTNDLEWKQKLISEARARNKKVVEAFDSMKADKTPKTQVSINERIGLLIDIRV